MVNIDYESRLFDESYRPEKYQKFNQALEHIFFYINQDPQSYLKAQVTYSDEYLKSIEKLGFLQPNISSKTSLPEHFWWGSLKNIELEKKLNSKLFSAELGEFLAIGSPRYWPISSVLDLENAIRKEENTSWLLRDPYKMSGQGAHLFQTEELKKNIPLFQKILTGNKMLLNPYCNRVLDIGFTFNLDQGADELFFIINKIDNKLSFSGGEIFVNEEDFYREFSKFMLEPIMLEIRKSLKKVIAYCQQLGAKGYLQIDTFIYLDNKNELRFNPLVEINYRRTMGQLLFAFKPLAKKKIILRRIVDQINSLGICISPKEFKHQIYVEII